MAHEARSPLASSRPLRVAGSRRRPCTWLPQPGIANWVKGPALVVGPEPRVRALDPASTALGAALRIWMLGERRYGRGPFRESADIPVVQEAGGGWVGDHLIVRLDGGLIRIPLSGTTLVLPEPFAELVPLEAPLPEVLLPILAAADPSKGRLGYVEALITLGTWLELHAVVQGIGAPPSTGAYRASARSAVDYLARPDLAPCVLRFFW